MAPLSSQDHGYNPKPTADDEVHVLVCVLSANSSEIKQSVLQKMSSVRQMASEMGKNLLSSHPPNTKSPKQSKIQQNDLNIKNYKKRIIYSIQSTSIKTVLLNIRSLSSNVLLVNHLVVG